MARVRRLPAVPVARLHADEPAPAVPLAHALDRPRGPARRGGGAYVPGSRHRGADGDRRAGAAVAAVALVARLVGGEPPLLQLVRPARAEGPQRLPHVRPPHGRAAPLTWSLACASGAHPCWPCCWPSPPSSRRAAATRCPPTRSRAA